MKRSFIMILLIATLLLTFVSCGIGKPEIKDYEWEMLTVMHMGNGKPVLDATIVETAENGSIELTLLANDGKLTVTDVTNNKTYEGTYSVSYEILKNEDYNITINGRSGHATIDMRKYADGKEIPILLVKIDEYSIYFLPRQWRHFFNKYCNVHTDNYSMAHAKITQYLTN